MKQETRIERKFVFEQTGIGSALLKVKLHPAGFKQTYPQRQVNTVYLETPSMTKLFQNVSGITPRTTVRVRWYGDMFGTAQNPMLELKTKRGNLTTKSFYPLLDFEFNKIFLMTEHIKPKGQGFAPEITEKLKTLSPISSSTYTRRYFSDPTGNIRLTVDEDPVFYRINAGQNNFLNKTGFERLIVIELKYAPEYEQQAAGISANFQARLAKHSKFSKGALAYLHQLVSY